MMETNNMELTEEVKFDRVMRLAKSANISVEEAKSALEANSYDMLDAMIYLEALGKVSAPQVNSYTTQAKAEKRETVSTYSEDFSGKRVTFREFLGRVLQGIGKIIQKGNENFLDLTKDGKDIIRIPLTIVVILLLISFWFFLPLAIVLLFFGIRYSFSGKAFKTEDVFNSTMRKASDVADSIKREFTEEIKKETNKNSSANVENTQNTEATESTDTTANHEN